jgi:glycosyltransferase involved in cell wall biosynthesis
LFTWIGFEQVAVTYERDSRQAGASKWSWLRLLNLAIEGITSFTAAPLRFASVLGLTIAGVAFVYGLYIIYNTIRFGHQVAGYPSLMTAVLFLGGVQLTAIGILGEYLGRVFNETKRRPLYHVKDYRPAAAASAPTSVERAVAE